MQAPLRCQAAEVIRPDAERCELPTMEEFVRRSGAPISTHTASTRFERRENGLMPRDVDHPRQRQLHPEGDAAGGDRLATKSTVRHTSAT